MTENSQRDNASRSTSDHLRNRGGLGTESIGGKVKGGKSRWFTLIKEWLSASEPSTQALKSYKQDAYKRAGTSPQDPQANAKLHIPVTTLPAEAIRPSGRGPEPEEIARRKVEQRKKLGQSFQTAGVSRTSQGSRSSASQHSSFSGSALTGLKEDA